LSNHNLYRLDVDYEYGVFRDRRKLRVTVAQVGARSEPARASGTNALESVSETRDHISIPDCPNRLLVFGQKISAIELNVVSEPNPVTTLQFRPASESLRDNPDARL
jgi:hypothetical protein